MSIFNAVYILGGLIFLFIGLHLLFQPTVGTIIFGVFSILAGIFFFFLGLVATVNHVK